MFDPDYFLYSYHDNSTITELSSILFFGTRIAHCANKSNYDSIEWNNLWSGIYSTQHGTGISCFSPKEHRQKWKKMMSTE